MVDHNLVFRRSTIGELDDLFDLGREDIHALHLHHIVRAPDERIDARERRATFALTRNDARKIVRTITYERSTFFAQRGDNELADLSIREHLARLGIHDLEVAIVIPYMHAAFIIARNTNAGTVYFRKTVDVIDLHAQFISDTLTHLVTPTLGSDDRALKIQLITHATLGDLFGQEKRIRAGRAKNGRLHVLHEADLLIGIARPHGNRHRTKALGA